MREGLHGRRWPEALIPAGLFALALLIRGWELGLRPAAPEEAAQAWAAWRGGTLPPGGSPLLAGWNATAFGIFGPDEGWMRSGAALAGALTVLALWAVLRPIGPAAAIGAAWLWAVSPSALMAARFLDGGVVVAAVLATALALWRASFPSRWIGLGIALGMGAAAGPAFWTGVLLLLPVFWLDPPEPAFPRWKALGVFGVTALLAGAWGGWRGSGARETVEGLSAWLTGFAPEGLPVWWEALRAFLYGEALILTLGLTGGILSIRRRDRFGTALAIAAGIGTGLQLVRLGAPFTEHAVALIPWVVLAGVAVQWVWETVKPVGRLQPAAVLGGAGIGGIGLGTVAAFMNLQGGVEGARWLVLLGILGLLGFGIWILSGLFGTEEEEDSLDRAEAGREPGSAPGNPFGGAWVRSPVALGVAGVLALALGLGQLAGAAARVRRADPVPGFSLPEMTAPAVREVVEMLRREAARRHGWPGGLSVVVVAEEKEAFWRWTFRGFRMAVYHRPPASGIGDVWLTPEDMPVPLEPDRWLGRPFPVIVDQRGVEPMERRMTLWVREEGQKTQPGE
ncbi:hypothetical protein HRbin22_00163 [Candidatus Thermoflexus japonica]|uniref:Glycosyltransferase RgtA/B/C/D-like domain-containing protein n=1 Tax=Candidatus Thermoflexus japonica TaxID=2035417 RepID=A0A2H5Y3C4_9CHLR|nr:hypothetical protein HRbin22_00163 [Candidatus Thermoflexus japonica]